MALNNIQKKFIPKNNNFYRNQYHHVMIFAVCLLFILMMMLAVVVYQMSHRPLPQFSAIEPDGKTMLLIPYDQPNLMPNTILRWASKAATVAYTFDFVRFNDQIATVKPYFTEYGWIDYLNSVTSLITTIVKNQLFVNGVVSGTPVISNQGVLPGKGFVWRVQIPFLVTYQGANAASTSKRNFYVILSIVRVPTNVNKQAIGIDQFLMV